MHLVDTNVLSELARPRPSAAALGWIERESSVAVSVITIEDLAFGVSRAPVSRRVKLARWLESLVSTVEVLDVTAPIARAAGELRASCESAGRPVAQADMLICATARGPSRR